MTDQSATELRIDDLARAAGTTTRNVRAYQDRGLLPAPRREGRIAWYGPAHRARLVLIGTLLERGFTLNSIGELLDSWHDGQNLGDLLGFGQQLVGPFTDEVPDVGTPAEIVARYGVALDEPEALPAAFALGLIELDGDRVRVPSPRLLRAGVELHQAGIPYEELFAELGRLRTAVESIAERFIRLVVTNVIEPHLVDGLPGPGKVAELTDAVRRIRPLATTVVTAALDRALAEQARAELGERLTDMLAEPPGGPEPQPTGGATT